MIPPPEDFIPIIARCPGCSRRLWALAPLAWPVRIPLPARCCSCGAWLKVERSKKATTAAEAETTETTGMTKARETTKGTAKVGPEALVEWPIPSLPELQDK